jgi:hypothetical protein
MSLNIREGDGQQCISHVESLLQLFADPGGGKGLWCDVDAEDAAATGIIEATWLGTSCQQQTGHGMPWGQMPAWSLTDNYIGQLEQRLPFVPAWQRQEGVHAHDKGEAVLWVLGRESLESCDCVAGSVSSGLNVAQFEALQAFAYLPGHVEPGLGAAVCALLVGRKVIGHQPYAVQSQLLFYFLRRTYVTQMDGVEGAAEYANSHLIPFLINM